MYKSTVQKAVSTYLKELLPVDDTTLAGQSTELPREVDVGRSSPQAAVIQACRCGRNEPVPCETSPLFIAVLGEYLSKGAHLVLRKRRHGYSKEGKWKTRCHSGFVPGEHFR